MCKRFPISSQGFHTWDENEIETFYTGAAKCDAVALGRGTIRDGRIVYRRRKAKKNPDGFEVNIPVQPYLAATSAHVSEDAVTYLQTEDAGLRSANGLGTSMRSKWCGKAGLPQCNAHGLHKAMCRRIAKVSGNVFKAMAVSGHMDIKKAQKHCDRFNSKGKADSAIAGLLERRTLGRI